MSKVFPEAERIFALGLAAKAYAAKATERVNTEALADAIAAYTEHKRKVVMKRALISLQPQKEILPEEQEQFIHIAEKADGE